MKYIEVYGAKVHNLKNIDVVIPRNSLTVITGLSGSGKSSLAFDTIYAEGQRRYMETLSSYARQFVGSMERPDVENIVGLSPVVAIEQKTTNKNPRSTVGTVTEINDFLRLLYARASIAYSSETGERMVKYSDNEIVGLITEQFGRSRIAVLAPVVKGRKGHYRDLFESFIKKGYTKARIDGVITELTVGMKLDRYKIHNIELVVDRIKIEEGCEERLLKSLDTAMHNGEGTVMLYNYEDEKHRYFSRSLMCPTTGIAYSEPQPHSFSFNSPHGACPHCNGLGRETVYDISKIIPDRSKSIAKGGMEPLGKVKNNITFILIETILKNYNLSLEDPIDALDDDALTAIISGVSEPLKIDAKRLGIIGGTKYIMWEGIADYIDKSVDDEFSTTKGEKWRSQFIEQRVCSVCNGSRLKQESLQFKIDDKNIGEVSSMSITQLLEWVSVLRDKLDHKQLIIASEIIKEISERVKFLLNVGLGYLSLSRPSGTLSGGESQRIRLATQIGSKLVNVVYILDEPSIGLHSRDNRKLIDSLMELRDMGNTVIVVEHEEDMIRSADWIIDIGPRAGVLGGEVVAQGTIDEIIKLDTITADYLTGRRSIDIPKERRKGNGNKITIRGARGNNLKNIDVDIPLGVFTCVTGVSGSGKSTLINATLRPILARELYNSYDTPLEYSSVEGIENIDKLVVVDQAPIGRTPRSNPATYTNLFADIRKLFENTTDAKIRGFKAGRFSFNMKGGRCEECRGAGVQTIEMNFLPDVYVKCKVCNGARYNRETLQVKYKGKSINDVLNMTVEQASLFFASIPQIKSRLDAICDVGLGYITLGQPSTTLSGGESQRIKLAAELSKRDSGKTLFILDEPTTGLHFEDVRMLLTVLDRLVDKGNSVLVIEHNMDVIRVADYLIDIGPEGGGEGGRLVACGTPEKLMKCKNSYTAAELNKILKK